jgi:AraC-like DNA-binding protein
MCIGNSLNIACYGYQFCFSHHYWNPGIRSYYLIYYVIKGKGTYRIGNNSYHIKKGNAFLIEPGIATYYEADETDPWEYVWVGFSGAMASQYISQIFTEDSPFISCKDNSNLEACVREMISCFLQKSVIDISLRPYLYKFLYCLNNNITNLKRIESRNLPEGYVELATGYIDNNYFNDISIDDVSKYVNLTRAYLFRLFKKYLRISPQQYLINIRMEKACELLQNSDFAIGYVARSAGYRDVLLFTKIFKKKIGITPTEFRNLLQ